ncbi:MAG: ankyrin repeat domain-containing protein [Polyangiales bacterium]
MTAALRSAAVLVFGLALLGLGCDGARHREAEQRALQKRPPVANGNINQTMGADQRIVPKLPTPQDRFLLAVRDGDRDAAARWLEQGANVHEGTVLVASVRGKGDLAFTQWLVATGASIDTPDDSGRTPLSWAAGRGSPQQVDYLLKQGASVESTDRLGRTPLHFAVFSGQDEVVERLLAASAAVNARDSLGSTPLMYACSKNQNKIVQALLDRGADPSLRDKLGRTAEERGHGADNPCVVSSPPE